MPDVKKVLQEGEARVACAHRAGAGGLKKKSDAWQKQMAPFGQDRA